MAKDLVESGMTIQSDPFGFGMTEEERFNVSAPKLAYDILGDSFFKMTKAQRDYVLELVRSGDLTASEIKQAAEYALPYDPALGRSEQQLTYVPPGNDRLFLPEEAKSLRAKEMSEAEFYKTFFNYDYKETEIPQEIREIYAGLMGTSVENTPKTSDNLPRQRIVSPTPDSEKRIAMATGGDTYNFLNDYGSFSTMTPISTQQYLSGPVDFYRQTLGTGIQSSVMGDDDKEEEEDTAPDIFKPIGSDDDSRENMSTLSLGLDAGKSFDPASVNSYNTYDVKVPGMDYTGAGFFSDQTADLVQDFAGNLFDNLGEINEKAFKGFGDVVSGDVSLSDAIDAFGTGLQVPGPTGKMRMVSAPPAILSVMGPYGSFFGSLAALGGAANMAMQKQNAAIFKATGAGFFGEVNGMMVSRKPGSFVYSGNLSGISQEQMKNLEAVQKGFIPGTLVAETYSEDDGKWSYVGGTKDIVRTSDVFSLGGTYNANGNWVDLSGQGYAFNTQQKAEGYAQAINNSYFGGTTNVTAEDIKNAQAQVQTEWSFLDGTKVKQGTPTFHEIVQETLIDQKVGTPGVALGAGEEDMTFREVRDLDRSVADMVKEGVLGKTTGNPALDKYIEESVARQKEAYAKEEAARKAAVKEARAEAAAKEGYVPGKDYTNENEGSFGGLSASQAKSAAEGSNPGDRSVLAKGGRVGMRVGGETGFVERPEFVGGKQSQPDKVSVADDQPRDVPEGTFVINAAAADFAGRDDIEKMIRKAYKKVGDTGQSGVSQEVAINVSKGEVLIPPHIAKIIGYDRLNKINNRGKKEISRRQEAAGGGFIDRKKFATGDKVTVYRGEPLDPSKVTSTDYGYGKQDVGKFHTPSIKKARGFARGAGKGNQVIKSRKVTIDELFDGVEEAWKVQAKKKTDYFAKMPKSELNKNLRYVKTLRKDLLSGKRSLESMAMFLQEQVFHDDKSKINFIETFKNDPKSAGKLVGRALTKVATKATPPLAILGVAAEVFTPSQLGDATLNNDSFLDYSFTPSK